MPLQPLVVAVAIGLFRAVDLLFIHAQLDHRQPRHAHRRFEHLANRAGDRRAVHLHQATPIIGADIDCGIGKRLVNAAQQFRVDHIAIDAEQQQLRLACAGLAQQIDPRTIAIVDLRAKAAGGLDHFDVLIDQRYGDALFKQHLRHRLSEPAIADDQRAGAVLVRRFQSCAAAPRLLADARGDPHEERGGRHRQRHHRPEQARRFGRDQIGVLRLREQHEAELTALAEQQTQGQRLAPFHLERQPDAADDRRLGRDQRQRHADDEQRPLGNRRQVEHHADREKEQAEQNRSKRLDIGFQLVPIRAVGKHHARDERAQRGRQAQSLHHRRAGDDREQRGENEHLALAQIADQPEHRPQHESADQDQPGHRKYGIDGKQPPRRPGLIGRIARERGDDRDQRHDRQVLKQQDRERPLTERRAQSARRLQHWQHLRRR